MRTSLAGLLLLLSLLSITTASAQSITSPVAGATLVGTFPIRINIERGPGGEFFATKKRPAGDETITVVGCFSVTGGKRHYVVATDSIGATSNDSGFINLVSTSQLYRFLETAAVEEGTALGYTTASTGCDTVQAYSEACVTRTGSGLTTNFAPCDRSVFSARNFLLCSVGSVQTVTQIASTGTACSSSSGCEATNPPVSGGGSSIQ